ncbi:MAG: hypothetical protein V4490_07865 [Pseudomonadota bacterium]
MANAENEKQGKPSEQASVTPPRQATLVTTFQAKQNALVQPSIGGHQIPPSQVIPDATKDTPKK